MVYQTLLVIGSLGLFLYGMMIMSDGIQKVSGERLQSVLNHMTGNRFASIVAGSAITAIIQSSTATTVMVVSFVNSGLLQLGQAISVIMGANIGTTITGWIVAFFGFQVHLTFLPLTLIGLGFVLLIIKQLNKRNLGEALIGFGLLFVGLNFLKSSIPTISEYPKVFLFLQNISSYGLLSYLLFIIVGIVLSILLQASSAAVAITLALGFFGWIDYPTAAAIILGENIGTTLSANIASLGTSLNARRAGRAHTLFNIFGVVWMTPIFLPFLHFIDVLVPGKVFGPNSASYLPLHLAMFHTLFNLVNTIICSFFLPFFARLVTKLVPGDEKSEGPYTLRYIKATLRDTPELYLLTVKRELLKMGDIIAEMFGRFWTFFSNGEEASQEEIDRQKEMEDRTDQMQEEITKFLSQCSMDTMNSLSARHVHGMIRITNELESVGDSCYNLMLLSERRMTQNIEIEAHMIESLQPYVDLVQRFLRFIRSHLNEHVSSESMAVAYRLEDEINTMRNLLKEESSERLQHGSNVKAELLFIEIVRHVEQIGDHCLNIVQGIQRIS
ncbi:MAG: Na/Pi cotransporter family protein [Sphaerochaetaceae bacterium]